MDQTILFYVWSRFIFLFYKCSGFDSVLLVDRILIFVLDQILIRFRWYLMDDHTPITFHPSPMCQLKQLHLVWLLVRNLKGVIATYYYSKFFD
jgi:hypothetical protein